MEYSLCTAVSGERRYGVGFTHLLGGSLRYAPGQDFAFADKFAEPLCHLLHIGFLGYAVCIVQLYVVCLQSFQAAFNGKAYSVSAELSPGYVLLPHEGCRRILGAQYNFVTDRFQGFPHQFFVAVGGIYFGRVVEGASHAVSLAHQSNRLFFFGNLAVCRAETHATHADGGDFQVSQFSGVHRNLLSHEFVSA